MTSFFGQNYQFQAKVLFVQRMDYTNLQKIIGQKYLPSHFLVGKNYNCDFSVLKIISQQKVLVGALVIKLMRP